MSISRAGRRRRAMPIRRAPCSSKDSRRRASSSRSKPPPHPAPTPPRPVEPAPAPLIFGARSVPADFWTLERICLRPIATALLALTLLAVRPAGHVLAAETPLPDTVLAQVG